MYSRDDIRRRAFVEHGPASLRLVKDGPLADLSFAVKDLIDIAGFRSAWGNPDRLRDAQPALATAPAALVPLMAAAHLIGKTHTDEVACGMFGMNPHFGIPVNPKAPTRVPGGSSSGSASAVAAELCDFALGTDTGGSIRVPASFCGLYGLRTTFGRLSVAGIMAMAPSFDTVGWLARDARTLKRVGEVYFGPIGDQQHPRLLLATDAFDIPVPAIGATLLPAARAIGSMTEVTLFAEGVEHWLETFRPLQLHALWPNPLAGPAPRDGHNPREADVDQHARLFLLRQQPVKTHRAFIRALHHIDFLRAGQLLVTAQPLNRAS